MISYIGERIDLASPPTATHRCSQLTHIAVRPIIESDHIVCGIDSNQIVIADRNVRHRKKNTIYLLFSLASNLSSTLQN